MKLTNREALPATVVALAVMMVGMVFDSGMVRLGIVVITAVTYLVVLRVLVLRKRREHGAPADDDS